MVGCVAFSRLHVVVADIANMFDWLEVYDETTMILKQSFLKRLYRR